MILGVRWTLTNEHWASCLMLSFRTYPVPGNVRENTPDISVFRQNSDRGILALAYKIARFCLVPYFRLHSQSLSQLYSQIRPRRAAPVIFDIVHVRAADCAAVLFLDLGCQRCCVSPHSLRSSWIISPKLFISVENRPTGARRAGKTQTPYTYPLDFCREQVFSQQRGVGPLQ